MKKLFPLVFLFAMIGALFTVSGCGPFWVDPYIVVKESPLNWVQIQYYNLSRSPVKRIGVYISGDGLVEVKKGVSDQISDDFAKGYKSDNWDKMVTYRIQVDKTRLQDLFQNLVNHGLLDKEKNGKASKKDSFQRFIAVKANICGNTYSDNVNIFEVDPDLAEQLLDVVREFDNPTR